MPYSETLKFKNFEIILESGSGGCVLDIDPSIEKVFLSFRFSKQDIMDILNEIKFFYSDSKEVYEASSLDSVLMVQEEENPPSLEIMTNKTFIILFFTDKDEVIRFQSEVMKAYDSFDDWNKIDSIRNIQEIFNKYGHQSYIVKITKEQSKNGIMEHPDFPGDDVLRGKKCSKCGEMMTGGFQDSQNQFVFGCECGHDEFLDVNGNLLRSQD